VWDALGALIELARAVIDGAVTAALLVAITYVGILAWHAADPRNAQAAAWLAVIRQLMHHI
jgi:hypothetical protein